MAITLFYNSCRKKDLASPTVEETETTSEIENKFFNDHRTTDANETAIIKYLEKYNYKKKFVEKTVKQIGYPRWDKSMFIKSSGLSRGSSTQPDITLIPFVRDSQDYVNASLVVRTTPTDTSFNFLSDWEYKSKPYGIIGNGDTTAEMYSLLFIAMDKNVFDRNFYDITDSLLFNNQLTPNSNTTRRVLNISTQQSGTAGRGNYYSTDTYLACFNYYHCTHVDGYCTSTICDMCAECFNQSCFELDITTWIDAIGGGEGGGGGTGGGGGGVGGGDPTPPSCGGVATRGALLYGCEPGWHPIGIDNPPLPPAKLLSLDASDITDPCLQAVIQNIGVAGHSSYILRTYFQQQLGNNTIQKKYKVKYLSNTQLTGNNGQAIPAQTNVVVLPDGTNQVEITLNRSFFQYTTKEWVTSIILHELLHGILAVERPDLNTSKLQHEYMFDNKAPLTIMQSLQEIFPSIDVHDAIALGMGGLSEGYLIPGTNSIDPIKDLFSQEKYFQNINQAVTTESNYQNAITGFGTAFC